VQSTEPQGSGATSLPAQRSTGDENAGIGPDFRRACAGWSLGRFSGKSTQFSVDHAAFLSLLVTKVTLPRFRTLSCSRRPYLRFSSVFALSAIVVSLGYRWYILLIELKLLV
jgi:hypothetical protein